MKIKTKKIQRRSPLQRFFFHLTLFHCVVIEKQSKTKTSGILLFWNRTRKKKKRSSVGINICIILTLISCSPHPSLLLSLALCIHNIEQKDENHISSREEKKRLPIRSESIRFETDKMKCKYEAKKK